SGDPAQGGIGEDHVGGDSLLTRLLRPPRAQFLEEVPCLDGEVVDRAALSGPGGTMCLAAQGHRAGAGEHLPARLGDAEVTVVTLDGEKALRQKLADNAPPFLLRQLRADTK